MDLKAAKGEAAARGLSSKEGVRLTPSTLDEDWTRTGYDVVELARQGRVLWVEGLVRNHFILWLRGGRRVDPRVH